MPPHKIKVGKTYCNRGKGKTRRTVLEIGKHLKAEWYGLSTPHSPPPDEPVVKYMQDGNEATLYLSSFAKWAGKEVEE
jgi:predicted alpha/beta superfamily hydrolase